MKNSHFLLPILYKGGSYFNLYYLLNKMFKQLRKKI